MNLLLDTNVVSELHRDDANPAVERWLREQDAGRIYLSVLTLGELRYGLERLPEGDRKLGLTRWIKELRAGFAGRILPVDEAAAEVWGYLTLTTQQTGSPVAVPDLLIAATPIRHGFAVATRNVKDFEPTGVAVLDPWSDSASG